MATPTLAPRPQPAQAQPPAAAAAQQPAAPPQTLSATGREFIINHEGGLVNHYYNDNAGHCTFGAGTLVRMGGCTPEELHHAPLSRAEMEAPLQVRIEQAERAVRRNITTPLTQAQFDALVSLTYNAGPGAHGTQAGAQPMYQEINRVGADAAAARLLLTAIHSRHIGPGGKVTHPVNRGIVNRRHAELDLYQGRR